MNIVPIQSWVALSIIFILGLLQTGCSGNSQYNAATPSVTNSSTISIPGYPTMSDSTVLNYLPSSLSTSERVTLYPVLAALPERMRANVFYYDQSQVEHTNQPSLFVQTDTETSSDSRRAPDVLPTLPACNASTDVGMCTGVLYMHKSLPGYGYFGATMNVPCSSTVINDTTGNYQGNVYVTFHSSYDLELGIQYNSNGSNNVMSVQPYYSDGGRSGPKPSFASNPHLVCNQSSMPIEAYIAQASSTAPAYGVLYINGSITCSGTGTCSKSMTTVNALAAQDNLTQTCPKCSINWTTAIAVPAGSNPQTLSGSYYGLSGCTPTLAWNSVTNGYFASAGPSATAATTPWSSSTVASSPSNAVSLGLIRLNDSSAANSFNEIIGIDETGCIQGTVQ